MLCEQNKEDLPQGICHLNKGREKGNGKHHLNEGRETGNTFFSIVLSKQNKEDFFLKELTWKRETHFIHICLVSKTKQISLKEFIGKWETLFTI
jgi:hypothetical protein